MEQVLGRLTRRTNALLLAGVIAVIFQFAATDRARAAGDDDETWVSVRRSVDSIGWDEECGPRLQPLELPTELSSTREGTTLTLHSGDFTAFTSSCPPRFDAIDMWAHGSAWRLSCSDAGIRRDFLYAFVGDSTLEIRERVETTADGCAATVLLTASFTRSGGVPASPAPVECDSPGPVTKIEISPAAAMLRPGGSICFTAEASDANGCPVDFTGKLAVYGTPRLRGATLDDAGCFEAPTEIPAGTSVVITAARGAASGAAIVDLMPPGDALHRPAGDRTVRTRSTTDLSTIIGAALVVGLACALAVLLGHFITLWSRRRRPGGGKRRRSAREERDRAATTREPTSATTAGAKRIDEQGQAGDRTRSTGAALIAFSHHSEPELPRICPACGEEYKSGERFCLRDGSQLLQVSDARAATQGAFCPKCHRGFEPGTATCPHHGEELLPYALHSQRESSEKEEVEVREERRICPNCNARYATQAHYCGADGSELVLLN